MRALCTHNRSTLARRAVFRYHLDQIESGTESIDACSLEAGQIRAFRSAAALSLISRLLSVLCEETMSRAVSEECRGVVAESDDISRGACRQAAAKLFQSRGSALRCQNEVAQAL